MKRILLENKYILLMLGISAAYIVVLQHVFGIVPSLVETIAVIFGIIQLDLFRRQKPAGFVFNILYSGFLIFWFASIMLYGQVAMRAIFVVINLFGLYFWLKPQIGKTKELKPSWLSYKVKIPAYIAIIAFGAVVWKAESLKISADWMYALAAVIGQIFISKKKIDSWVLWLCNDVLIGLPLFFLSGSWMYLMMTVFMIFGEVGSILSWRRQK
ncbi:MAG: nicotinamide riboside transporter PnuC [Rickettsiales bacterium]|jgi:nicotinamide mononucleotide transporter|nr:nicotinamide riboside transporter PnuC [Rickettsiales bacterium]